MLRELSFKRCFKACRVSRKGPWASVCSAVDLEYCVLRLQCFSRSSHPSHQVYHRDVFQLTEEEFGVAQVSWSDRTYQLS